MKTTDIRKLSIAELNKLFKDAQDKERETKSKFETSEKVYYDFLREFKQIENNAVAYSVSQYAQAREDKETAFDIMKEAEQNHKQAELVLFLVADYIDEQRIKAQETTKTAQDELNEQVKK